MSTTRLFRYVTVLLATVLSIGYVPQLSAQEGDDQSNSETLPAYALKIIEQQKKTIGQAEEKLERTQRHIKQTKESLKAFQARLEELNEELSSSLIPKESHEAILSDLHSQRIHLSIDLAGLAAREKSLIEASNAQETNPLQQQIIENLEKQVGLIKEDQKRAQRLYAQGSIPQSELDNLARMQLTAELKLLEMQMSLAGSALRSQELQKIVHDRAESKARLAEIENLLPQLTQEAQLFLELQRTERKISEQIMGIRDLENDERQLENLIFTGRRKIEDLQQKTKDDDN